MPKNRRYFVCALFLGFRKHTVFGVKGVDDFEDRE